MTDQRAGDDVADMPRVAHEETVYIEYRIRCLSAGCDFALRHRGGKQREVAMQLFRDHECRGKK